MRRTCQAFTQNELQMITIIDYKLFRLHFDINIATGGIQIQQMLVLGGFLTLTRVTKSVFIVIVIFHTSASQSSSGTNIVLTIKGNRFQTRSDEILVIGAHYDSQGNTPGE